MDPLLRHFQISGVSTEGLCALEAISPRSRMVRPREIVLASGSRSPFTHYITEGWAARYQTLPDGSGQITNFLLPGDFCDLHFDAAGPLDHDIIALTRVHLASFETRKLRRLEAADENIAAALWRSAVVENAILRAWITNIGQREADARVAHLLRELYLRLKHAGLVGDHTFSMPLTQQELSEALGITAVHVNRVLQRLRADGLLHLEHRVLTLLEPERMDALAGFDPSYLHLRAAPRQRAAQLGIPVSV